MSYRIFRAALIAVSLVGGVHAAVHYAIEPVARAATLEARLFQPILQPSGYFGRTVYAQATGAALR